MRKGITLLCFTVLSAGLFFIMSCQKEKQDSPYVQPSTIKNNTAKLADSSKDYKISIQTASAGTKAWREQNQAEGNKHPNSYKAPIGGILQLIKEAEEHKIDLSGIRFYMVIIDGKQTMVYTPVDKEGNDAVYENGISGMHEPVYDGGDGCPPTCGGNIINNVLNSQE